ncbi:hypothetical protein [Granulicella aggregans]|nr:hypothetical protein [Granulicella aggregans]
MSRLLSGLLKALDSDEREAVSGDLLEARESPSASALQVLGLILKRQLDPWAGWRPWLLLITVALPLAVALSQATREFAGWSAIYSWMLINNTDAALLRSAGFWSGVRENSWKIGEFALVLFCCSWACGRLIAQLSRKAHMSMAFLFVLTSLFVLIAGIPSHARAILVHSNDRYFPNGAVFANAFYRDWFPLIVYAITVLVPLLLGFAHAEPAVRRPKALRVFFYCSTALVAVGLVEQPWLLMEMWSWQMIPVRFLTLPSLLPVASIGPACLLVIDVGRRSIRLRSNRSTRWTDTNWSQSPER